MKYFKPILLHQILPHTLSYNKKKLSLKKYLTTPFVVGVTLPAERYYFLIFIIIPKEFISEIDSYSKNVDADSKLKSNNSLASNTLQ